MNDHNINIENEQWVNNLLNNNSKYLPEEKKKKTLLNRIQNHVNIQNKKRLYEMKLRLGHTIIVVTIVWCNCS